MKQLQEQLMNTYNKLSNWAKILLFIVLLLLVTMLFKLFWKPLSKTNMEGFGNQNESFVSKTGINVYDNFYADVYDHLVYNNLKNSYEIDEIVNKTYPTYDSVILDVGSGSGHHVADLVSRGYNNTTGVDISGAMVQKAKQNYPNNVFIEDDINRYLVDKYNYFTHILCLYFTIYYMPNKQAFLNNCFNALRPAGYLIIHLVDRDMFDPILPPGNPLLLVSPQKYAKQRITTTKITFNDMLYSANFNVPIESNITTFDEKFVDKNTGKIRTNEHTLYMESETDILTMAQNAGFIIDGKIDLLRCHYEYQYLFILYKPA